jgi:hypothetical protein
MKRDDLQKAFEEFCEQLGLPVAKHGHDGGKYYLDHQPVMGGCLIRYIVDDGGGWTSPFFSGRVSPNEMVRLMYFARLALQAAEAHDEA